MRRRRIRKWIGKETVYLFSPLFVQHDARQLPARDLMMLRALRVPVSKRGWAEPEKPARTALVVIQFYQGAKFLGVVTV